MQRWRGTTNRREWLVWEACGCGRDTVKRRTRVAGRAGLWASLVYCGVRDAATPVQIRADPCLPDPPSAFAVGAGPVMNSPQCLHLTAAALMTSAQAGHVFSSDVDA